jgi:hypothetical protein
MGAILANMDRESARFLRALRGRRSQVAWARRLGYRGNPCTNWERGKRFPTAREVLRMAAVARHDVAAAFAAFTPTAPLRERHGEYLLAEWLDALRGGISLSELAARSAHSRFSVRRWLRGEAEPRLPDFFRLVDALTGRLPEWVASFVPIESVPSLAARHAKVAAAKRIAFEAPWSEAVLRLLETDHFRGLRRHDARVIAELSGISELEVQQCLDLLGASGVLERRHGKYRVTGAESVDTQGGRGALHRLKAHWAAVAARRLATPDPDADLFAYNVVSIAAGDMERIRNILRTAFREIRSVVASSEPPQVVALLNLQLCTLFPQPNAGATLTRP